MEKSNKELAVELAKSALQAVSQLNAAVPQKPLSGSDIRNILKDCYTAVCELESGE